MSEQARRNGEQRGVGTSSSPHGAAGGRGVGASVLSEELVRRELDLRSLQGGREMTFSQRAPWTFSAITDWSFFSFLLKNLLKQQHFGDLK